MLDLVFFLVDVRAILQRPHWPYRTAEVAKVELEFSVDDRTILQRPLSTL